MAIMKFSNLIGTRVSAHIHNFIPLFIKNVVFVFLSFFQLYILTNYLGIEQYGELQFVLTLMAAIVFFTLPGSNLAYNKMGANNDIAGYFPLLKYKVIFSLIGSLVLICVSFFYYSNKDIFYCLLLSAIAFPLFFNLDAYLNLLNGQEKFHRKVKYEILKQVFCVSMLLLTVVVYSQNIFVLLLVVFSSAIFFNLLAHVCIFKGAVKSNVELDDYKKYTNRMSWLSVVGVVEVKLDRLVVGFFFGFENLAVYHVAKIIQEQFKNLWIIFANLITPITYHKSKPENVVFLSRALCVFCILFLIVILISMAVLPLFFSWFMSEQYVDALLYLDVMLLNVLFGIPAAVLTIYFNTFSLLKIMLVIKISGLVFYIILLVIFSYYWQVWGVIYANLFRVCYLSIVTGVCFFLERRRVLN